jgi:hypothetical protein
MMFRFCFAFSIGVLFVAAGTPARAQLDFERPPIDYHQQPTQDPVAKLQSALDAGEATLEYDPEHGYLPSLLRLLEVPQSSQMLVFSKTSFQLRKITPQRPRAIYFNDNVYLGWVQHGDVIEVSAVDPQQGGIYYTLSQEPAETPKFVRDRGQCLTCHASSRTQGVPGHLVRSVFADRSGQPMLGSGTFTTDHRSPFDERWGGWYVSGTHGAMRHMGNVLAGDRDRPESLDREAGANVNDLASLLKVEPYLEPTSDIVALMVLEHQTQMHNLLTLANYEARSAAHYDRIMNEAFERPADHQSESTQRRIASVGEKVLQYLLFSEEFQLTSPVQGASKFAEEFAAGGKRDPQGRSLRDFDLHRRLFKYPCSYLIDSPSFDSLPAPVKSYLAKRLDEVLTGKDQTPEFAHLSAEDRRNIREILEATKPDLFSTVPAAPSSASQP